LTRSDPVSPAPARLLAGLPLEAGVRLLEARGPDGWSCDLLALDPEVEFRGGRAALEAALDWLRPAPGADPWERVLIGSLAYELGAELEPALPCSSHDLPPPVDLAGFRALYRFDAASGTARIDGGDERARGRLVERLRAACRAPRCAPALALGPACDSLEARAHARSVEAIRGWIARGDVYQVNLSRRLGFAGVTRAQAPALYARLARAGDAPFAAYLETPERVVLSNSPERFLRVAGRHVETCPIKGTRPRGATPEADRLQAEALLASAKDAAEHLMIVDLERNDLGRVCEIGSVRVARFAELRSFAAVHHCVSSVRGRLRAGVGALELLTATFPGGSITGAPKLRAMQIIDALEPVGRDVYTGAIGYLDAAGGMDLSIAIRTAVLRGETLYLHAGGGIVADSNARDEWLETEAKLAAFRESWGARA
jgi:para-aminobenzoate synthetase component 1